MTSAPMARAHAVRAVLASGLLVALVAFVVPSAVSASAADDPTSTTTTTTTTTSPTQTEDDGPLVVTDAVLSWGLNDESNNKAFAPGTYNFLSAGAVPDPGKGGATMEPAGVWNTTGARAWRATDGETTVQKLQPDGTYATATFAGLKTDVDGDVMPSTSGPFSGHRVTIGGGTGDVDLTAGTARIEWDGAFSVVYYSGYTFFTVSDPVLVVTADTARVRATLSGYAADRTDPTKWVSVDPQQVTLADLPRSAIDLGADVGFAVDPAYLGVTYGGGAGDQVRSGDSWGAFPTSFLAYMDKVGSAAFFYSSGGSADPHKVPKPMLISYDAAAPVEPDPTDDPTDETDPPTPTTTLNPTAPASTPPAPTTTVTTVVTQPAGPALPPLTPPAAAPPVAAAPTAAVPQPLAAVPTAYAELATVSATTSASATSTPAWPWWLGAGLLAAAAALALPLKPLQLSRRKTPSKGNV